MARFTTQELDTAITEADFGTLTPFDKTRHKYEQILIAYEWLDAQPKIKRPPECGYNLKHIIEAWGEYYIPVGAVIVAAHLHPQISGRYPCYNISARLILPDVNRLSGIPSAFKHPSYGESGDYNYVYGNRKE